MSSHQLDRAKRHMPLGVADNYRYWGEDETVFVQNLQGPYLTDSEGKTYVDFRLAYGPIILGYRDPRIDSAVIKTISEVGTMSGFSTELDSDVCELIKSMCPQIEKLRFANSGTEAVLASVRTARAWTKKQKIVVIEGGFHGLYDEMMWKSDMENWDPSSQKDPDVIPFGIGLAKNTQDLVELIPLNCFKSLEHIFKQYGNEIAAVIIEPIMGNCGSIEASKEYMQALRDTCDQYHSLLIIDEVKTGFRVGPGGAQEYYGIYADLTTFAKAIANGYPLAAFGGKAKIMDLIGHGNNHVVHGGTYTANLIGLSAAKATLEILSKTDAYQTIQQTGLRVIHILEKAFKEYNIDVSFSGPPSMFGIHLSKNVSTNYRNWKQEDNQLYVKFAKNLIKRGIMLEPDSREPWFICEAHATIDFNQLEDAVHLALKDALNT